MRFMGCRVRLDETMPKNECKLQTFSVDGAGIIQGDEITVINIYETGPLAGYHPPNEEAQFGGRRT